MGTLDFLEKKPSNIVITTTNSEIYELGKEASNCLPASSIQTVYSKLGLSVTSVKDYLNAPGNCAVRISSDVNFIPNGSGKVYTEVNEGEYTCAETVFNIVNFDNGIVYAYTKGDISYYDDPVPCIIVPKTFTDSESSDVFEKGVYLGAGIYSGGQMYYTKFEQKIPKTSINISGKGFVSPREYCSMASNSIEADDYYTIWINFIVINEAGGKDIDYNAICIPGDWNSKADIQLDEKLAKLLKAMSYNKVSAVTKYINGIIDGRPENLSPISIQNNVMSWVVNKGRLTISYNNNVIFKQTYDVEEYTKWHDKYFPYTYV